jgi:hypothetical protein
LTNSILTRHSSYSDSNRLALRIIKYLIETFSRKSHISYNHMTEAELRLHFPIQVAGSKRKQTRSLATELTQTRKDYNNSIFWYSPSITNVLIAGLLMLPISETCHITNPISLQKWYAKINIWKWNTTYDYLWHMKGHISSPSMMI